MKSLRLLLILTVATSSGGCDKIPFLGGGGADPAEVARLYWAAMAQQDLETAGQYAFVGASDNSVSPDQNADFQVTNLLVADAAIGGDRAVSRTTMHASGDGMDADLDFSTTLVRIDGDWKVDQNETLGAMGTAIEQSMESAVTELGQTMAQAMGEAVQGMAEATQQPARAPARQRRAPIVDPLAEIPWEPEMIGTVNPGMTRDEVVAIWGEPLEERVVGIRSYMYFRNGCERRCGTFDLVLLEGGQVIDAIVRGSGHVYSGISSSPPDRLPQETLPGGGLDLP